jgi:ribosomal protein S18 acetylase RimI-like enzyme
MAPTGRSATLVALAERVVEDSTQITSPGTIFQTSVSPSDLSQIFTITKTNMEEIYNRCGSREWFWDDVKKKEELICRKNRFFISRDSGMICGFIVFRFLIDNGVPVAYVWEIQVATQTSPQTSVQTTPETTPQSTNMTESQSTFVAGRRKGIGTKLMSILEQFVVNHTGIRKISLTVLNNNIGAKIFYKKIGYTIDKSTPSGACFSIMSKLLK